MLRTGTGGGRSGALDLTNARIGYDLKAEMSASASASATSTPQYKEGKAYYDDGKSYYDKGRGYYDQGKYVYDTLSAPPVEERYAGRGWSAARGSDPSLNALAKALDDAAAQGEETRAKREDDIRKRSAAVSTTLALIPGGVVVGAALYAFTEGMIAFGKWYGKDPDSEEDRNRARDLAGRLWGEWMILPPFYDGAVISARTYGNLIENAIAIMERTEAEGPPWQEEWRKTVLSGVSSDLPMARDVSALGWIPFSFDSWACLPYAFSNPYLPEWANDLTFGQCRTRTYKPGWLTPGKETETKICTPPFEEFLARTDRYAAGVAVAMATRYGVSPETVVEAAIAANRKYLREVGPIPMNQGWRLKGVFFAAWEAAGRAPKLPMRVTSRYSAQSSTALDKLATVTRKSNGVVLYRARPGLLDILRRMPPIASRKLEDRGLRALLTGHSFKQSI